MHQIFEFVEWLQIYLTSSQYLKKKTFLQLNPMPCWEYLVSATDTHSPKNGRPKCIKACCTT